LKKKTTEKRKKEKKKKGKKGKKGIYSNPFAIHLFKT